MKLWTFYERTWEWLQEAVKTSLWINKSRYIEFITYFTNLYLVFKHLFATSFQKQYAILTSKHLRCKKGVLILGLILKLFSEIQKNKVILHKQNTPYLCLVWGKLILIYIWSEYRNKSMDNREEAKPQTDGNNSFTTDGRSLVKNFAI